MIIPVSYFFATDKNSLLRYGGGADITDNGFVRVGSTMNITVELKRLRIKVAKAEAAARKRGRSNVQIETIGDRDNGKAR